MEVAVVLGVTGGGRELQGCDFFCIFVGPAARQEDVRVCDSGFSVE